MRNASMLAVCLAATVFTRCPDARKESPERTISDLAVFGGRRPVEPRTSVETPYAPFKLSSPLTLSGLAAVNPRLGAEAAALCRLSADSAATSIHASAVARLYLGEWQAAIDELSRVRGKYALDEAAAYYMRGLAVGSLTDFTHALEVLSGAGDDPAVLFNRALVMEQLRDRYAAAREWSAYLLRDHAGPWAAEARRHLAAVEKVVVVPKDPRKLVVRELLPQWGDAILRGDAAAAARHRARARAVADAFRDSRGDRLPSDAIDEIASAPSPFALARAYVALRASWQAIDATRSPDALELTNQAMAHCPEGGAARALLSIPAAAARYYTYDYAGADRFAEQTMKRYADREGVYIALFAHLAAVRGVVAVGRGDVNDGLHLFERSLAGFERVGEADYQAKQHTNLADTLMYLGDTDRAAIHRYRALVLSENIDDPPRVHAILSEAAEATLGAGFPNAALLFEDRLVRLAEQSKNPLQIADALITRSTIYRKNGRRADALRDLSEADRQARQIEDERSRARTRADVAAAEAYAYRGADDRRAIAALSRAIDFAREVQFRMSRARLLLERGRARNSLGDTAGAEKDFRAGVGELEQQRSRVSQAELRITYYDRAERLFVELAQSYLRRGAMAEAFDIIERSRGRELLDATSGKPAQPLSAKEIQRRLPAGTTVVTYSLTDRSVLISVIGASSLRVFETAIAPEEIEKHVDAVSRAFEAEENLPPADLGWLSDALIRPLGLPDDGRIVFVPDQFLHGAPFAALSREGRSYLVENHMISIAPSATMFIRDRERDCSMALHPPRKILAVASAERPAGFEQLEPLVRAPEEAAKVAALYPEGKVLLGSDPGANDFLALGRGYGAIHFTGHSIADPEKPSGSMLLIGEHGRVPVGEIESASLPHCRLVVLGACSSAMGKVRGGEGALSLARAFLAASVPSVVATVARVGDTASEELLTAFHAAYEKGDDAAAALRAAQLRMIHRQGSMNADPTHWSAFEVIGGTCGGGHTKR